MEHYLVNTPCGALQGTAGPQPGVAAYRGIRYATAARWQYPTLVTHWEGVYDASAFGACCWQPRAFADEATLPEKQFYYREFREGIPFTYSEDCLFLNVFAPENAAPGSRLPVLVYIHGGAFLTGSSDERPFDAPVWPLHGVIAVTINYRLGPLGFAALPELTAEAGHTGNYALYDQKAALEWVQANIAAFGGDPDNVTIMGQSAGAMSVQQLVISPLTDGLFHKAVMCSGGGANKMFNAGIPAAAHYDFWHGVMRRAGCADLAAFRALAPDRLFAAWQAEKAANPKGAMAAAPVLDGALLPEGAPAALEAGHQKNIPYMAGTTSEDMMPPIMFRMAKEWCRAQADQGKQPSYLWFFDRQLPGDDNGAWHSSDLWYWFGALEHSWRPMTEKDATLARQMVAALMNFCKTGDPNGEGLPARWLPMAKGQPKAMRFGEAEAHMGGVNMVKLTKTMLSGKSVGQ